MAGAGDAGEKQIELVKGGIFHQNPSGEGERYTQDLYTGPTVVASVTQEPGKDAPPVVDDGVEDQSTNFIGKWR